MANTKSQLSEIYQTSKSNVSEHIKHIFEDGELDKNVVVRNFRITTQHGVIEGKTQLRNVAHYNLDMVIALGYCVQSQTPNSSSSSQSKSILWRSIESTADSISFLSKNAVSKF